MKLQLLLPALGLLLRCPGHDAVGVQSKVLRRGSTAAAIPGDDVVDDVREAAERAKEKARESADKANEATDKAKERAKESAEKVKDMVKVERLDYNRETYVAGLPLSIEFVFASVFVALVGSVPFVIVVLMGGGNMTKAHIIESVCLVVWLVVALVSFCKFLEFNSAHWDGSRSLTVVEAVYLLSQILTTVGYGDITPAHPFSQVWVAMNVLLAMMLYGSVIMECTNLISAQLERAIVAENTASTGGAAAENDEAGGRMPLRDWHARAPPLEFRGLAHSFAAFLVLAAIGVVFYHYFPGEGKTWLQAVYMSVITLSTVGFGWFNATSEGGKVFGAFWMLFGVTALAATITNFVNLMTQIKAREQKDVSKDHLNFFKLIQDLVTTRGADKGMDSYSFVKFGLLLRGAISEEEVEHIEKRFAKLSAGQDRVSMAVLMEAEAPPRAFQDEKDRRT